MEISLAKIIRLGLNINEYLTLFKVNNDKDGVDFPFTSTINHINSLVEKGYLEYLKPNVIALTAKGMEVVKPKEEVNFDDLFLLYPAKTPNGRILRTRNKEIGGRLTREYKFLKDKYSLRVFDQELHQKVLLATKNMLSQRQRAGDLDYLQQLEVYINRNGWERYMDQEEDKNKTIIGNSNVERI
jgi:hypothetical protein